MVPERATDSSKRLPRCENLWVARFFLHEAESSHAAAGGTIQRSAAWCGPTRVQDKAPWNNRVREDLFCLLNLFRNCFALPPAEGKSSPRSAVRFCPEALRSPETQRADANALRLVRSALLRADWTNEEAIHQPLA
jgi:hypothetical protein